MAKHTLRLGDLSKEDLKEMADDLDVSLSEIFRDQTQNILRLYEEGELDESPIALMNSHTDNLIEDDAYRDLHQGFYRDNRDFENFVSEENAFDTKWVEETSVEYDFMLENFQEIVYKAERHDFEEAEEIIDDMRDQGYEREAYLFNSVVSKYRE